MTSLLTRVLTRLGPTRVLLVGITGSVVLFLFTVRLLGTATNAAAPLLGDVFSRMIFDDASALGLGWLGTYALANGSVVAALSLSLFAADILSVSQLFLMVAGSRLGSAAVVVFIGTLDYVQKAEYSFRESVSMGLLTFLLTHSIYVPVTVLGYVLLPTVHGSFRRVGREWSVGARTLDLFDPVTVAITNRLGPVPAFVLAVGLLFGSLRVFDTVLERVDTSTVRRRVFRHFERTWVAFGIGLVGTGITTSVAFSLGIVVPLYNRGYVKRNELIPYVLGANLGTLFDTLVVAVALASPAGVAVVLELLTVATIATVVALLAYDTYSRVISNVNDRLLADRRVFVLFVLSLVLVPLALLVLPLVVG
ncbi:sodium:phosphate symporter [Halomicroarcula sp. S1AR25-4]|uniref:sodium:phosphate symporter n=1 Tax=Haloarcula sp. S1AR25-4 TaxID=2950538 RepID=UPI002875FD83|nr:sodium:phosphate symporter [Halomicroarcula sp. S1AR25-4]MDS0279530.1 sodium:phosphate symporter [Halomicroarcula sp. S1AR25-4]